MVPFSIIRLGSYLLKKHKDGPPVRVSAVGEALLFVDHGSGCADLQRCRLTLRAGAARSLLGQCTCLCSARTTAMGTL